MIKYSASSQYLSLVQSVLQKAKFFFLEKFQSQLNKQINLTH